MLGGHVALQSNLKDCFTQNITKVKHPFQTLHIPYVKNVRMFRRFLYTRCYSLKSLFKLLFLAEEKECILSLLILTISNNFKSENKNSFPIPLYPQVWFETEVNSHFWKNITTTYFWLCNCYVALSHLIHFQTFGEKHILKALSMIWDTYLLLKIC